MVMGKFCLFLQTVVAHGLHNARARRRHPVTDGKPRLCRKIYISDGDNNTSGKARCGTMWKRE